MDVSCTRRMLVRTVSLHYCMQFFRLSVLCWILGVKRVLLHECQRTSGCALLGNPRIFIFRSQQSTTGYTIMRRIAHSCRGRSSLINRVDFDVCSSSRAHITTAFLVMLAIILGRVMDEFDVFMDAMSRNIAISQVIQFARKHNNRQFILITPQVRGMLRSLI